MVGVEDEQHIHRPLQHRVRAEAGPLAAEDHVEEVRREREVPAGRNRGQSPPVPVRHRRQGGRAGDEAADLDGAVFGVGDRLRLRVHRAEAGEQRDEHRHRVGVRGEPLEEPGERLRDGLVPGDVFPPASAVRRAGELAAQQQPGDVEVAGAPRELLDRVAPVAEDAAVAVYVGDPADAGGGVLKAGS